MNRRTSKAARARIQRALDVIRPALRMDGGDIEFVGIDDDGGLRLRLLGACRECPSAGHMLSMGVERSLRHSTPGVTRVICV